jgi:4-amino-4-deoxy-L-arabinose transferase-like glycosyltransferase
MKPSGNSPTTRSPDSTSAKWVMGGGLLLVLLIAAALRLGAVGYGRDDLSYQIDEDRNVSLPLQLSFSSLQPHDAAYTNYYDYPALLWYALFALDRLVCWVGQAFRLVSDWETFRGYFETHPIPHFLLARTLSAAFGTATVAALYCLGRTLFSPAHALLAAAFLAGAFLHVRDSALATVDAPTSFLTVLALLGATAVLRRGWRRDYLLAGSAVGLTTATKYNAIVVVVSLVMAHLIRTRRAGEPWRRILMAPDFHTGLLQAGIVFLAVNPYLLLDWSTARVDLLWLLNRVRIGQFVGVPLNVGPAWWYHLTVSLRYGMGLGLSVLGVAGVGLALWYREPGGLMLASFVLCFFLLMGSGRLAFIRYMTPLVPVLCLLAASAILVLVGRLHRPRARLLLTIALGVAALVEPLNAATAYVRLVHRTDTRVAAYRFLLTLPPGSDVATYGPSEVWRSTIPPGRHWLPILYAKHPEQTWAEVLAVLKQREARYLLVHSSTHDIYSPIFTELEEALSRSATLLREFSPYRPGLRPNPVYDRADPYFFPIGRFDGVTHPGPLVRIYHLD